MGITTKGQVTIPQDIRNRLGLLPYVQVEFKIVGDSVQIRKASQPTKPGARGEMALRALRGSANTGLTTKEIMALTRG